MKTIQSPLIHPADVCTGMMTWFILFFYVFVDLIPELSIDELRCRFLGVVDGDDAVAVAGGAGFVGGDSNGSGGGWVPFFPGLAQT